MALESLASEAKVPAFARGFRVPCGDSRLGCPGAQVHRAPAASHSPRPLSGILLGLSPPLLPISIQALSSPLC